jgi:ATP-dependent Clp protease ATP-binding subunit ClpX
MSNNNTYTLKNPSQLIAFMDTYVVKQDEAKKALAYCAFMHDLKELAALKYRREGTYKKSVPLLIGPTGVGKTYLIETLAKVVDRDLHTINAKDLVSEGYKGNSFSDYIKIFAKKYTKDAKHKLESSIIFIDEFDKLCTKDGRLSNSFDIPVQQQLLKVIEGNTYNVNSCEIDTSRIMFVLGGNFQHMRDARTNKQKTIGFNSSSDTEYNKKLHEELAENGVIKELIGRISIVAELRELSESDILEITETEDNVIKQYKEILDSIGVKHKLTKPTIKKIVSECVKNKTGARGLQTAVEQHLIDIVTKFTGEIVEREYLGEDVEGFEEDDKPCFHSISDDYGVANFEMDNLTIRMVNNFTGIGMLGGDFAVGQYWRTIGGSIVKITKITQRYMEAFVISDKVYLNYELDGTYPDATEMTLDRKVNM